MNIRVMLALVCLAGWLSTAFSGQPATQDVAVDVQVDSPPAVPNPVQVYKAKRWVSYEVQVPVTTYRTELHWRLEEYDVPIPDPGPQPPNQVLSDPCVQCPPASSSVNVDIDVPAQPSPPQPPECIGGRCFQRIIGNRADGTRVDVNVDTRPRGLFWRFRR